jgi:hypothetical protein
LKALKARNKTSIAQSNRDQRSDFAPSALRRFQTGAPWHGPRLLHFAPLALKKENRMSSDELLINQRTIIANQNAILENQEQIKSNQAKLDQALSNQATIISNQQAILSNQAKLDTVLANQERILANQERIIGK